MTMHNLFGVLVSACISLAFSQLSSEINYDLIGNLLSASSPEPSNGPIIRPTKTFDLDNSLVATINQTLIPYPVIQAFLLLDFQVVSIFENFTASKHHHKVTTEHQGLIQSYINDWWQNICRRCDIKNAHKVKLLDELGDPVIGLRVIRRLRIHLPTILQFSTEEAWQKNVIEPIRECEAEIGAVPDNRHIAGHSLGLMKLAHVYDKLPHQIYKKSHMTFEDVTQIGLDAFEVEYFGRSVEWFSLLQHTPPDQFLELKPKPKFAADYIHILSNLSMYFNDMAGKRFGFKVHTGIFPVPLLEVGLQKQSSAESKMATILKASPGQTSPDDNFRRLCQGFDARTSAVRDNLFCRLDSRKSEWLLLMPAKLEEISLDPQIFVFHDVVRNNTMHLLRQASIPIQDEAMIRQSAKHPSELSFKQRMSFASWLPETMLMALGRLQNRVAHLTGLKASDAKNEAEAFQMNVYGSGGHYSIHKDAFGFYETQSPNDEDNNLVAGDRMATFMIYMNEVESGGRTVFPVIGATVEPTAGSAVFWWNLHPSGKTDERMYHAGCPVISGVKWVCNRWIRHNAQAFTRPCLKHEDSIHTSRY